MAITIENVPYGGWKHNVRLANREVELMVTGDVGPRVIRFGFIGERNVFAEMPGQIGGTDERGWRLRGGHRLWAAPEEKPKTYEPDNGPVAVRRIPGGIRTLQPTGPLSGVQKSLVITLSERRNAVSVTHVLTNRGRRPVTLAPWALTVMAPGGMAVIPLPAKLPHTERLTHNQEWSLWGYTDFADPRWTLGSRYVFFRQDRRRGPAKLGVAHREGWVAYQLGAYAFVKCFAWQEGAVYPDGGVNFETFSNEDFLEVETLGPLVTLAPGRSTRHREDWALLRGLPRIRTERDADRVLRQRLRRC
jgi:hypothetical protein